MSVSFFEKNTLNLNIGTLTGASFLLFGVLKISLDSLNPLTYSELRKTSVNSFEKVIKLIKLLPKFDVHSILASVPLTINQNEITSLMDFALKSDFETFSVYKPIPINRAQKTSYFINETNYLQLINLWMNHFTQYSANEKWLVEVEQPFAKASQFFDAWSDKLEVNFTGCKAGKSLLSINPDGKIMPCPGIDFPEFYLGDAQTDSINEIWNKSSGILSYFNGNKKPVGCENCSNWVSCFGGCRACAFGLTNNPIAKDPFCDIWLKGCTK